MLFRSTVLLAALLALVPSSIARYNYDDDQGKGKGGKKDKAKKMGKKESKGQFLLAPIVIPCCASSCGYLSL